MAIPRSEDGVRFCAISIPWTSPERDGDDARDLTTDPARPFFGRRFVGAGSAAVLLARLLAIADPERPIPARTEASADRAGGGVGGPGR